MALTVLARHEPARLEKTPGHALPAALAVQPTYGEEIVQSRLAKASRASKFSETVEVAIKTISLSLELFIPSTH
ncbi:hypothetical protein HU735_16865 [Pseudomonas sp. BW16M2]|uniref:hypothetical protein n=1 Tax=Pseudomonas sp. BW16M2 TaxID=2745489 RepID=UPI001645217E|nr:hypothetical protein [Pseudomonas sp. BW16M2]MBC3437092.1 hypothetical protein [Pseudomonas sp. BW16M2]